MSITDPRVKKITDLIHDLLPHDEPLETVRVSLDVPKAWFLLGALIHASQRNPDTGALYVPPLDFLVDDDGNLHPHAKRLGKRWLYETIREEGHTDLHYVCHGARPPFSEPEDKPKEDYTPRDLDGEIPF